MCDRDECSKEHREGGECVTVQKTKEMAVVANVFHNENGILAIQCADAPYPATMKSLIKMLMVMQKLTFLVDRVYGVWIRFGGVVTTTHHIYPPNFECNGPVLGVTFSNRIVHKVCADGARRTEVPTLRILAGGGGPEYHLCDMLPVAVGKNLLKVMIAVVPVECKTGRQAASSG